MTKRLGFILSTMTIALLATDARALDTCDALGLSGLTISSDEPLQISGGVNYEFRWGDYRGDPPDDYCYDDEWELASLVRFSNMRVRLDPGFLLTAPDPIGLLESGAPAMVPGYTLPMNYSGFKLGVGIDTRMQFDGFVPMDLGLGFEFGQITGRGQEGLRTGSYGIPSVGVVIGSPVGTITTISSTDAAFSRTFGGFDKQVHMPLFGGEHEWMGYDTAYVGYLIGGTRFGMLNETQQTRLVTNVGTLNYDTTYNGGYAGAYLGLGMDKSMQMPGSDLMIGAHASLTGGFDMHHYRATASIGGTAIGASTNTYDVSDWVPTLKLGGGLSIGKDGWLAGIDAAVSSGYYPTLRTQHSVSNVLNPPALDVFGAATGEISGYLRFRY